MQIYSVAVNRDNPCYSENLELNYSHKIKGQLVIRNTSVTLWGTWGLYLNCVLPEWHPEGEDQLDMDES